MLFIFRIFPTCAVKASWTWINFSSQHEQAQTFVFIRSAVEQGQGNFEVISECVAFTISCVSLPSHGWIINGYPTLISFGSCMNVMARIISLNSCPSRHSQTPHLCHPKGTVAFACSPSPFSSRHG